MEHEARSTSATRPDWTYSVPPPRVLSPLWVLEILASLSVPLAAIAGLVAAISLGWISFN